MEWINDDFLNSILETNCLKTPFKLSDGENVTLVNANSGNSSAENSSDSGMSSNDQSFSSRLHEITDDISSSRDKQYIDDDSLLEMKFGNIENSNVINSKFPDEKPSELVSDDSIDVKEEVIECKEVSLNEEIVLTDVKLDAESYKINDNSVILLSDYNSEDENILKPGFQQRRFRNANYRKDPVLIPNAGAGFKNLKVVGIKRSYRNTFKSRKNRMKDDLFSSDEATSDESDSIFPKLYLSPEEKKIMIKEGIVLPSHYPLTKMEEKDLKRIRRKIRNKISAQDSRRRKKQYVDGLEERVKLCSEENVRLLKCIKQLQTQNVALVSQVRKLQASVGKTVTQPTQPSTCLLVLFLSLALVLAPALRNNVPSKTSIVEDEGISLSDSENSVSSSRSRNLLYSEPDLEGMCAVGDEPKVMEEFNKVDFSELNIMPNLNDAPSSLDKMGGKVVLNDHDYFRPRKRPASSTGSDSEDLWPTPPVSPAKLYKSAEVETIEIGQRIVEKTNNKTRHFDNHPIIIDLLD